MTPKQELYRKQLIIKIHTNKHYKEIKENGAWQDWLSYRFNVLSSKELSIKELNVVLDILNGKVADSLELEPDIKGRKDIKKVGFITKKQLIKLLSLKNELGYNQEAFFDFIYKQTKKPGKEYKKMTKKEATRLISILNKIIDWKSKNDMSKMHQ